MGSSGQESRAIPASITKTTEAQRKNKMGIKHKFLSNPLTHFFFSWSNESQPQSYKKVLKFPPFILCRFLHLFPRPEN